MISNRVIENTIRQIRESQAEKEKTKDARQKLDEFKQAVGEEIKPSETASEGNVARLARKVEKIKPAIIRSREQIPVESEKPFVPGDAVRMTDTLASGEIIRIENRMAQIETGSLTIFVPLDKIERISRSELRKSLRSESKLPERDPLITQRKLNFKPEIDIRGIRGEEALTLVRDFIDNALMVQHRNLRILHGKGNGILRQLVREYLSSMNIVKSYRDEQVDLGGSGITVVEMDI